MAKNDETLWAAAIGPVLASSLVDSERYPLLDCVRSALTVQPSLREPIVAGLADPKQQESAAEALVSQPDEATERALVKALQTTDAEPETTARCWKAAKLSWTLSSVVVARKAATAETRALLVNDLRAAPACPKELTGKARRVYAVTALAAIGDEAVSGLASTCHGPGATKRVAFKQWNDAMLDGSVNDELPCVAKALTN